MLPTITHQVHSHTVTGGTPRSQQVMGSCYPYSTEFTCFCTMDAPATKPTGSAVTTDEPVPHRTITENYMESLEQQFLF